MKRSALILLSILFLALFLLGGDCGKGTIVEPADIDGIWRFYLSKSGESTETMLYINFIQSENDLIFFINPDENSNLYTDTITGNELSIAFNIGTDEILLSGTVFDNAMTGTWSDNTGDTGTFRAERGLDIGNASVVIPETGDILIEVEEENEIGSAIYYGTDEGDDGNPILTKCEFETDEGKCTITIDEEQRVEEISIADLLISFSYPSGSAFNYEIWQNGDQVYSGDIFIGQTEEEIATKAPRPEENGFTRLGDRHSSLGIEDGDEDEVTFAEGIRYCAYGLLTTFASVVTGEDDIEYDKEWMKHVYQETPVGELLINYVVIGMIHGYRFQNRDKLCEDQKDYEKCIDRANVVDNFLNDYLTSIHKLVLNIIAKEYGIHDEQNCDDEKDNDWDWYTDCEDSDCADDPVCQDNGDDAFTTNLTKGTWTIQLNGDDGTGMKKWLTWHKIYFQGSETDGILGQEGINLNGRYHVVSNDIGICIESPTRDEKFDLNGSFSSSSQMGGTWFTESPGWEQIKSKQWTGTWNKDG